MTINQTTENKTVVDNRPPAPSRNDPRIAKQLGIPGLAMEAAAQKFGWKKDEAYMVGRTPGQWQVMISRIAISRDTKRPDPAKMEVKIVCIDDDKKITFIENQGDQRAVPRTN